jgi:hypothetical protein
MMLPMLMADITVCGVMMIVMMAIYRQAIHPL